MTSTTHARRSRFLATLQSWRFLVAAILVALSCTYIVPIERSIGLFTATNANANTLTSGHLQPPVTLLANVSGPDSVTLNWPLSPSAFATGYQVYRLSGSETEYTLIATRGAAATSHIDAGLPPLTVHTYYIEAICNDWTSAPSPTATAVTP